MVKEGSIAALHELTHLSIEDTTRGNADAGYLIGLSVSSPEELFCFIEVLVSFCPSEEGRLKKCCTNMDILQQSWLHDQNTKTSAERRPGAASTPVMYNRRVKNPKASWGGTAPIPVIKKKKPSA